MTATTISFLNFKGGVGKTSTTALTSYNLAKMGKKVLVIDFDPQSNLTALFLKTKAIHDEIEVTTIKKTLMMAIKENTPLEEIILPVMPNLDMIPNAVDFSLYHRYLERAFKTENEKVAFLKNKLASLKDQYDFIFIDVPPTLSLPNDTAFFACDQIVVVLQTQERALDGAENLIQYLQDTMLDEFDAQLDVLGILPVLSKKGATVDEEILRAAAEEFGAENIFDKRIMLMERIKRMDITGITDADMWDKKVHTLFSAVSQEIIDRIEESEEA